MKYVITFALFAGLLLLHGPMAHAQPLQLPAIEVVPMKDSGTDRQYELYVKLPEDYDAQPNRKYPVIYYTDALWHVEMLSASTAFLMEDAIIVGISWQLNIDPALKKERGQHVSRFRDYSIRESSNPERQAKYQLGQASQHLEFIRTDVIQYVERQYRADPEKRTYFGYSLGGLFGAYILMAQPNTFNNYILGSPSLRGDMEQLSKLSSTNMTLGREINANVFVTYGSEEDELGKHIEEFITLLKRRNDDSLLLKHAVIAGDHGGAFPLTAVTSVTWLSKLYKGQEE
ncbi:MAG: alpha/beta hydrolase [Aestuariibacter sp.]